MEGYEYTDEEIELQCEARYCLFKPPGPSSLPLQRQWESRLHEQPKPVHKLQPLPPSIWQEGHRERERERGDQSARVSTGFQIGGKGSIPPSVRDCRHGDRRCLFHSSITGETECEAESEASGRRSNKSIRGVPRRSGEAKAAGGSKRKGNRGPIFHPPPPPSLLLRWRTALNEPSFWRWASVAGRTSERKDIKVWDRVWERERGRRRVTVNWRWLTWWQNGQDDPSSAEPKTVFPLLLGREERQTCTHFLPLTRGEVRARKSARDEEYFHGGRWDWIWWACSFVSALLGLSLLCVIDFM